MSTSRDDTESLREQLCTVLAAMEEARPGVPDVLMAVFTPTLQRLRAERDAARNRVTALEANGAELLTRAENAETEVERLLTFTATCTCGTTALDYEGPQADCMVHGAVRALNEAQAELARITTEIEAERDKVREAEGATARDESVIAGIYNGLGIALRIMRGGCPLCGGTGVVPGSEDYDSAVHMHNPSTGEPCDCVLRSES